jgi:hypothetical protein
MAPRPPMPWVRWSGKTKTTALTFRSLFCMVVSCAVLLAPARASSNSNCQAKESCDKGQYYCSICAEVKSKEQCTQIAYCDWLPSCTAAYSCSWFQDSACVLQKGSAVKYDVCKQVQLSEVCTDMDFCDWKEDCRQCANFSTNRECVSRSFCDWDQGTLPAYPITEVDIGFVVVGLLCELWTTGVINYHVTNSHLRILCHCKCALRLCMIPS